MIKGITDALLMPRIEKIRLGMKNKQNIPVALDYFLVPDWLKKYVGDKPTELEIMFASDDIETNFPHAMKRYGNGILLCKGDGEKGIEIDPKTGNKTEKNCMTCPYRNNTCKPTGVLRFILPSVPGLGIFQIDTRGLQSIQNIISGMSLIANLTGGRIRLIPLILTIEKVPTKYRDKDRLKDTVVHVLKLQIKTTPVELIEKYSYPYPNTAPVRGFDKEIDVNTPTYTDYIVEGPDDWEAEEKFGHVLESTENDPFSLDTAGMKEEDPFSLDTAEEDPFAVDDEDPFAVTTITAIMTNIQGLEDGSIAMATEDGHMTIHVPADYPEIENVLNRIVGKKVEYKVTKRPDGRIWIAGTTGNEIKILEVEKPQKLNKRHLLLEIRKVAGKDHERLFKIATMKLNKDIYNFSHISNLSEEELSLLLQELKAS